MLAMTRETYELSIECGLVRDPKLAEKKTPVPVVATPQNTKKKDGDGAPKPRMTLAGKLGIAMN